MGKLHLRNIYILYFRNYFSLYLIPPGKFTDIGAQSLVERINTYQP